MSFLGKLLVGLQLTLSIVFLTFAGAVFSTQQNWKKLKEDGEKRITDLEAEKRNAEVEFQQFKTNMDRDLKNALDAAKTAEGNVQLLSTQIKTTEQELATAKTERDQQTALAQVAINEAQQRLDEARLQRGVNNDLNKLLTEKNNRVNALQDEVFNKSVEEQQLLDKHSKVLSELSLLQKIVTANGLSTDPKTVAGLQAPPPPVDGEVLETKRGGRSGSDLVEISLGSDDGLVEGHRLSVYRSAQGERAAKFLGIVKIVYVTPDKAVGSVIDKAKNGVIEKGDNVTSKL